MLDPHVARRFSLASGEVAWPTLGLCAGALAAQAAITWAATSGVLPAAPAVLANALLAYAQFTVAHDAAHRAVARAGWLNDLAGHVAALVLVAPFDAFRRIHLHHHAHTNDPEEDPDFWVVGRSALTTCLRFATTWAQYYRVYFLRLASRDAVLARSIAVVAALIGVSVLATAAGHGRNAVLFWFLPSQLAVTLLALLFDYLPHRPHTERGRLRDTAAIRLPGRGTASRLLDASFLNQNLHLLHHLFPTIPWYRYRAAFDELEGELAAAGAPVRTLAEALRLLRPSLSRLPRV